MNDDTDRIRRLLKSEEDTRGDLEPPGAAAPGNVPRRPLSRPALDRDNMPLPRRVEQKKEAFLLVAPQNSGKKGWNAAAVGALLDDVVANHKVDKDRIYVTGLSMGGFGTWSLAAAFPDKFAAIIPICGGGNPANAKKIKDLPIWVFHGAKDQVVPASRSEAMVQALKDAGAENVKFTLYPNAGHDAWTPTYSNQEVWDWLLKQKRGGK